MIMKKCEISFVQMSGKNKNKLYKFVVEYDSLKDLYEIIQNKCRSLYRIYENETFMLLDVKEYSNGVIGYLKAEYESDKLSDLLYDLEDLMNEIKVVQNQLDDNIKYIKEEINAKNNE